MADSHCFEDTHVEFQQSDQKDENRLYLGIYMAHMTYNEIDFKQ